VASSGSASHCNAALLPRFGLLEVESFLLIGLFRCGFLFSKNHGVTNFFGQGIEPLRNLLQRTPHGICFALEIDSLIVVALNIA
jgi:hypothetical protein